MKNDTPIPRQVLEKFILGFPVCVISEELRTYLAGGLGGVIVFPRNFSAPEDLLRLTDEIRLVAGQPVLIGIDQEGGTHFALPPPFTQWPSAEDLGLLDDPAAVESVARGIARELAAVGCNLDFAPMLDLHIQPKSPVTSGRSYGANPQRVGKLGAALARGLAAEGVLACAKHFPGHGDTKTDPHESLPIFDGSIDRLRQMELVPFARVFEDHVPMVMTAHILLPKIDPENPATLSHHILTEVLRKEMKYEGVVLADDLGMSAIRQRMAPGDAAIGTFFAGSDMALLCHDWEAVGPALEEVAKAEGMRVVPAEEWEASLSRIEQLKGQLGAARHRPDIGIVGCAEYRALVDELRARIASKRKA